MLFRSPIESVKMVMVDLDSKIAGDVVQQNKLRTILRSQNGDDRSGRIPVVASVGSSHRQQFVRFGMQFRVKDDIATVEQLIREGFVARSTALVG